MDACDDLQDAEEKIPLFRIGEAAEKVRHMPGLLGVVDYIRE